MLDDKTGAKEQCPNVKELIDMLVVKYGSLRKAAEVLGCDHQLLYQYRKDGRRVTEFLDLFERMKKALKLSQAEALKLTKK